MYVSFTSCSLCSSPAAFSSCSSSPSWSSFFLIVRCAPSLQLAVSSLFVGLLLSVSFTACSLCSSPAAVSSVFLLSFLVFLPAPYHPIGVLACCISGNIVHVSLTVVVVRACVVCYLFLCYVRRSFVPLFDLGVMFLDFLLPWFGPFCVPFSDAQVFRIFVSE